MSEVLEAGEDKKKKSKKKEPAAPLVPDGMVLYADAGAKPNPGFAGWGLHGYFYSSEAPKKGSGNPSSVPTCNGYVSKVTAKLTNPTEITPLTYVDGFSALPNMTNNAGEIVAATRAMELALQKPIKNLTIRTDSSYVVKGATEYVVKWANNNWIKADGQTIANVEHWRELYDAMNQLKDKQVELNLEWVKGHNGYLGNTLADNYATIGRRLAADGVLRGTVAHTPAEGYWGEVHERHPFLHHACSYLTTAMAREISGEYYLGHHGKDDEVVGKRDADGAYAYVQLKEKDEFIEMAKAKTMQFATRDDNLILCRLDKLYERFTLARLKRFGEDCLYRANKKTLCLNISEEKLNEEPITTELTPPRIAIRAVEALNVLKGLLIDWRTNPNTALVGTDITDLLYDKDEKGHNRLKPCYTTGFTALPAMVGYGTPSNPSMTDISLAVGLDLPERNSLKKLEKQNPKVKVVTWLEADKAIRYACVVEAEGDVGIWAAFYSNLKYLK